MSRAQPLPPRPVHPRNPRAPAAGRTQPAPEHHRPPRGRSRPPPHPAPPVPAVPGQHLQPGPPRRQRPRQMPGWHPAPAGQLRLRHRIEEHLAVRTHAASLVRWVHPPPPSDQVADLQPVSSGHPVEKRPGRLTRHGPDPQDCFHSGHLSLTHADITECGGNGFAHLGWRLPHYQYLASVSGLGLGARGGAAAAAYACRWRAPGAPGRQRHQVPLARLGGPTRDTAGDLQA